MSKSWSEKHPHGRKHLIAQSDGRVRTLETELNNATITFAAGLDKALGEQQRKLEITDFKEDLIEEMLNMLEFPNFFDNAQKSGDELAMQAASILAVTHAMEDVGSMDAAYEWLDEQLEQIQR